MKKPALILVPLAAAAAILTGCGAGQDPCRDEPAPAAALLEAAQSEAVEIEREGYNEAECVLTDGGTWVDESELEEDDD